MPDASLLGSEDNFTLKTRQGQLIKMEESAEMDESLIDQKLWDCNKELESSAFDWQMGRGDMTLHIVDQLAKTEQSEMTARSFFGNKSYQHRVSSFKEKRISCRAVDRVEVSTSANEQLNNTCDYGVDAEITAELVCQSLSVDLSRNDSCCNDIEDRVRCSNTLAESNRAADMKIEETGLITKSVCVPCGVRDDTLPPGTKIEQTEVMTKSVCVPCGVWDDSLPPDMEIEEPEVMTKSVCVPCSVKDDTLPPDTEIEQMEVMIKSVCVPSGVRDDTLPPDSAYDKDCCTKESSSTKVNLETFKDEAKLPSAVNFDNFSNALFSCTQLETLKRSCSELDEEAHRPDDPTGQLSENQSEIARWCVTLSNILRNLSFVAGNEAELCRHSGLLAVAGKILLLHHRHPLRPVCSGALVEDPPASLDERCSGVKEKMMDSSSLRQPCDTVFPPEGFNGNDVSTLGAAAEWWWEMVEEMRDNVAVLFANISGHLDLSTVPEEICLPILDGLLHWSVCPSVDRTTTSLSVSTQRLALEALCKFCVLESNVDLFIATPPFSRVVLLMTNLVNMLGDKPTPVVREFAISLLSCLTPADPSVARALALQRSAVSFLLEFIEEAEQTTATTPVLSGGTTAPPVATTSGRSSSRRGENHDAAATVPAAVSLDMVCRAASILRHLVDVPDNVALVVRHEARLKQLAMSQVLDLRVTAILAAVLGVCS